MELNNALQKVAVLGAVGKMGSGIALLLLQEISLLNAKLTTGLKDSPFVLMLIDSNRDGQRGLRQYLHIQMKKFTEKNIIILREFYKNNSSLISNEEIIRFFVEAALELIRFGSDVSDAKDAILIFEAILEDISVKVDVYKTLKSIVSKDAYYFTNTSSIPISLLNQQAGLNNRIIGFHFYNPPLIQKVIEVVAMPNANPEILDLANELAQRLHKIVVHSQDVAGFIGNGHFIREVVFTCHMIEELSQKFSLVESIYILNCVTQDFLIRPMGIFQLIDYVGLNVVTRIANIMQNNIPKSTFSVDLLNLFLSQGIKGGQNPDGSQKNGILEYQRSVPLGVFSLEQNKYVAFEGADWKNKCDQFLGALPNGYSSWKNLVKVASKKENLNEHFHFLALSSSFGATLAQKFLTDSQKISQELVDNHVANNMEDINTILKNGFYHLYGPEEFHHISMPKTKIMT